MSNLKSPVNTETFHDSRDADVFLKKFKEYEERERELLKDLGEAMSENNSLRLENTQYQESYKRVSDKVETMSSKIQEVLQEKSESESRFLQVIERLKSENKVVCRNSLQSTSATTYMGGMSELPVLQNVEVPRLHYKLLASANQLLNLRQQVLERDYRVEELNKKYNQMTLTKVQAEKQNMILKAQKKSLEADLQIATDKASLAEAYYEQGQTKLSLLSKPENHMMSTMCTTM